MIFSRDKLELQISVDLQYFLNKEDLPELHDEYDVFYKEIFEQTAKDTVKVNSSAGSNGWFVWRTPWHTIVLSTIIAWQK